MIEFKNIRAGYEKKEILSDLSLTVRRGEVLSVVGLNGSGKSTLLGTVIGSVSLRSGEILADGQPLSELSPRERAKKVAYLSQSRRLPDMTAGQLILHGRFPHTAFPHIYSGKDKALASEAAERMGLSDLMDAPLSVLSGGTLQRAYIAMALCQDTDYILLDEPTASLDVSAQLELMTLLRGLAADGKAILTVMHDLPLAMSFSDRIAIISGGKIYAEGTPDSLLSSEDLKDIFGITLQRSPDGDYFYRHK